MRNIIISIIIVGIASAGVYYYMQKKTPNKDFAIADTNYSYSTSTDNGKGDLFGNEPVATSTQATSTAATATTTNNKKSHMITIETNYGKIAIETYDNDAPNTVNNFVTLANK